MASMVTAPSPSRSDPPPSFAVFVVVFGASPLEPPKPPDDSPLAIVQPSTAVCRSFTFTAICSSAFGIFSLWSIISLAFLRLKSLLRWTLAVVLLRERRLREQIQVISTLRSLRLEHL
ncbi:PREDICTED: uncharacterized protein LOC106320795 isoform X1 [Brassica oleracea var. oleracea]|uniref:uncharacterized protein LOC106320795 isoform X1 n=1 Tax=Brassica oleracea var. oleracea TaxID=109376 RepID=UPI0006A6DF1B|nr:PREDICTED: uncharacterized protein LOC106320795 isoform X1 [Brassica oleracea var. oleracea]